MPVARAPQRGPRASAFPQGRQFANSTNSEIPRFAAGHTEIIGCGGIFPG